MGTHVLWSHGNAMVIEDEGQLSSLRHRGWGTELNFNTPSEDDDSYRVCHIPLPSPPIVDGVAATLAKLFILFEASSNVIVSRLDVWDANNLVTSIPHHPEFEPAAGLFVGTGSHLTLDRNNQLPLPDPYVPSSGLGLSLACFLFGVPGLSLVVTAVGAAFVYPNPDLTEGGLLTAKSNLPNPAARKPIGGR